MGVPVVRAPGSNVTSAVASRAGAGALMIVLV
jgi:hypothetical protein